MSVSKDQAASTIEAGLNDELVREYLRVNSDFLQRNPDLLDHLQISHASGSAVSLVEKQVAVLRERNIDMRRRLSTLTANARDNDKLFEQTRELVLKFLEADSLDGIYQSFMASMRDDFAVEHASMILFGENSADSGCRIDSAEQAHIEIGALLKGGKAVCGALRREELAYLFPDAGDIGSAALIPISNGEEMGVIAVGSSDAHRYDGAMGTVFLSHIADVLARLLPRLKRSGG